MEMYKAFNFDYFIRMKSRSNVRAKLGLLIPSVTTQQGMDKAHQGIMGH